MLNQSTMMCVLSGQSQDFIKINNKTICSYQVSNNFMSVFVFLDQTLDFKAIL